MAHRTCPCWHTHVLHGPNSHDSPSSYVRPPMVQVDLLSKMGGQCGQQLPGVDTCLSGEHSRTGHAFRRHTDVALTHEHWVQGSGRNVLPAGCTCMPSRHPPFGGSMRLRLPTHCMQHSPGIRVVFFCGHCSTGHACFEHVVRPPLHRHFKQGSSGIPTSLFSDTGCPFIRQPGQVGQHCPGAGGCGLRHGV